MPTGNTWNTAAINGLLLSLITIVASLLQYLFKIEGMASIILWAAKLGGCIYLLHYFMKQHSMQYQFLSYGESFRYGFIVCAFSSIICAAFLFISLTVLFPGQLDAAVEQMYTIAASANYSDEEIKAIESLSGKLPQITLFTAFIYYTILGAVFSSIIAAFTKKDDSSAE